jgi:hypothetical protein
MGIKIDSCSCFKNTTDIAIEISMNSLKKGRIKIFAKPEKMELNNSISLGTILSKISNNDNDSSIFEKSDLKSFIKIARSPELIIQSTYQPFLTLDYIVNESENKLFDRKSSRIKPSDLAPIISAFANAEGGTVVIGIDDKTKAIEGLNAFLNFVLEMRKDLCNNKTKLTKHDILLNLTQSEDEAKKLFE